MNLWSRTRGRQNVTRTSWCTTRTNRSEMYYAANDFVLQLMQPGTTAGMEENQHSSFFPVRPNLTVSSSSWFGQTTGKTKGALHFTGWPRRTIKLGTGVEFEFEWSWGLNFFYSFSGSNFSHEFEWWLDFFFQFWMENSRLKKIHIHILTFCKTFLDEVPQPRYLVNFL